MKRTINHPNHEQACAVLRFAHSNGGAWKRALHEHWLNECSAHRLSDDDRALLRQVRNQCGPLWLEQVSLPALTATCVLPNMKVCAILAKTHYGLTPADLGLEERELTAGILEGESLLDLINHPAQKYDLGRLDKSHWGEPSTEPLNDADLAAAVAQLDA
jgi:hypothetical protein